MNLLYLIGAPGVGKSTTMQALTAGCDRSPADAPLKHDRLIHRGTGEHVATELGRARPGYPGTDTLPMNVSPKACAWLAERPAELLLAEGDRLAHVGFLAAAGAAGYRVTVAHLTAPAAVLDARCLERGSQQSEPWRRGRATKAARLAATVAAWDHLVVIDTANRTPAELAADLRARCPFLEGVPA